MSHPEKSELLFLHEEDFFGKIPPGKAVFDMTLEDYMASARIHAVAVRGECDVDGEEAPRAVLRRAAVSRSDVVNPPTIFLGGERMPDENLLNLMFSLGKTIYPSFPTHGIINKMLVMVAMGVRNDR